MKALVLLASVGLLAGSGKVITFEQVTVGSLPPGWSVPGLRTTASARWEVVQDSSRRGQINVFAQISSNRDPNRVPLAIWDPLALRDGDVSVRLKPVHGREDQGGGLVWRYRDAKNYYLVRADAIDKRITVYKVVNGARIPLTPSGVPHDIRANVWSILKISARGRHFEVYVNHHRVLAGDDNTFANAGKVGLSTDADGVTYFDDFRVYPR